MPANRLQHEKSPYLRQHANNPVDWYPWGEEAFEKARREDKPIFLSIGYSTCHWCHVMERESFESESTAALLNQSFVPVKVDREERPDIDRIYMTYVQATTGGGGWPMSVWLTPDLHPFVGGTYFPPDNRYGRPGFPAILDHIARAWRDDRAKIIESSDQVMADLRRYSAMEPGGSGEVDTTILDSAFNNFRRSFDSRLGGFGGPPKFPRPSVHNFLLRYWKRSGNREALDTVAETLVAMEKGGMNDQLGGGFHRYSVDEYWFVPHFEKMLYDQAQLVSSYLEAFQITGNETFSFAARRTVDYVLREMTSPEGAFWSAEDADSIVDPAHPHHKSEGWFYIWSWAEVVELLGEEKTQWFAFRYGMKPDGNVENDPHGEFTGRNILFQARSIEDTAAHFNRPADEMMRDLEAARRGLLAARAKRVRPHLDDKILTAWNGLMISAIARAGAILNEPSYTQAATRAADFLLKTMRGPEGNLFRRYREGEAAIGAMLDDYAFLIQALLDLYEVTFNFHYLQEAINLNEEQRAHLEDRENGGFYASSQPDATRLNRLKDDYDGAEPSGNSAALFNLFRLHRITGREDLLESAKKLLRAFAARLSSTPYGLPQMLAACEFHLAPNREIVIAGDPDPAMLRLVWKNFDPNRILLRASPEIAPFHPAVTELAKGPAAVCLCENFTCQAPATNTQDLARLLE
ncbi:MAG TPA: thioredoxin domain-containing protein [Bryobacteraceae bacterium]|nr:thioredoxin domain-containing protein [Bryobacteraceae bacterium]